METMFLSSVETSIPNTLYTDSQMNSVSYFSVLKQASFMCYVSEMQSPETQFYVSFGNGLAKMVERNVTNFFLNLLFHCNSFMFCLWLFILLWLVLGFCELLSSRDFSMFLEEFVYMWLWMTFCCLICVAAAITSLSHRASDKRCIIYLDISFIHLLLIIYSRGRKFRK